MSLRGVHILFVAATVSLSLFFAYWAYQQHVAEQSTGYLITAIASVAVAIGCAVYGRAFAQKVKVDL